MNRDLYFLPRHRGRPPAGLWLAGLFLCGMAWGQEAVRPAPLSVEARPNFSASASADDSAGPGNAAPRTALGRTFEAAWALQPEAQSLQARRDAAQAGRRIAGGWTPAPPALELSGRTARADVRRGGREIDAGLAIPIWLPGERARSGALADADARTLESVVAAARLRLAGALRSAYWEWQGARADSALARDQLTSARALADDVARRVRAGDLARSDGHQAEGAVAAAEVLLARALSGEATTAQRLHATVGIAQVAPVAPVTPVMPLAVVPVNDGAVDGESEQATTPVADEVHPALREWQARAEAARRAADLAQVQRRGNPELLVGAVRDRETTGDAYRSSVMLGVRVPFGSDDRHALRRAAAEAELREAEAMLALEAQRIAAAGEAARLRLEAACAGASAAERRRVLAVETRAFFAKSFRLGETDLPTRLRIEREAVEAERGAAAGRIEQAAAVSQWRQALGLLPD